VKKILKILPDTSREAEFWRNNKLVAGIDEAGRGALAGPVFAATVCIKNDNLMKYGINDSKKLSAKKRNELYEIIKNESNDSAFFSVDNFTIDKINILNATHLAMEKSVGKLRNKPDFLLIDGNSYSFHEIPFETIVGGDGKCLSIASASIIAKVSRDKWMSEVAHFEFPVYGFAQHKGYGTQQHIRAIKKYGICKYHRKSFLSGIMNLTDTLFEKELSIIN